MALPAARARGWAAAVKMAQRRRHAEAPRGSPSRAPPGSRAALYVHWPYCEKRCSYCNFNKYIPRGVEEAAMRSCLVTEAQTLLRLSGVQRVESVFFGGGTPSLASPNTVAAVLEAVDQISHLPADSEVTLEANPTSAPGSRLAAFGAAGVNRLSIGLQSLDDTELQLLGRTHSARDALQTLAEARRLFPGRVSVDLMLGLPAQQVQRGALPAPDPELAAEMYQEGRAMLREVGFRQYEVSNFARNGALSTHNWTYWQCGQYLGVGPGAHGRFVPQGAGGHTREARIQTLEPDNWMKEVMLFGHGTRRRVPLGQLELLEEVLAMGLRTDVGITHQHWQQFEPQLSLWDVFGASQEVKALLAQGLLLLDHRGLRCSWEGLAVLDSLLLTLLPRLQEAWQQRTPSPVQGG
ncbi:radical S-adenosyl methionine domain-containing protein 1, mitochondrial isoform X3 [Ursus maritimus]|uniref:Radical S-adenosyl methionine domain-containing protein 1, mitochondrial isoform X3 n=1 Tax=Ursus maritimus TaxID=29073 RepID=A0A8M1GPR8_URSMA|nr:radical S-adenosyl methionine domain-containing protein 1, mitochondrial isoform X3 [Ursus maritimus]XP_044245231.1 radical S-adenosyl methionine domain-containing protein 1, mitochondrial isoform X3 [Ursus arctos]